MGKNKKTNILKRALVCIFAISICLGTSNIVVANTTIDPANPASAHLSKTVKYAGALTEGANATFSFNFVPEGKDGLAGTAANLPKLGNNGVVTLGFSPTDAPTTVAGVSTVTKTTGDLLQGINWGNHGGAGTYTWVVTETKSGATVGAGETMHYSDASFRLLVKVAYDQTVGYYVESTTTDQLTNNNGSPNTEGKGGASTSDGANHNFKFTNIYSKEGGINPGEETNEALVISKVVVNSVDANKDFSFTIKLDDSLAKQNPGTYVGTVYDGTTATTTKYTVVGDNLAVQFKLKEGQKLVFNNIPVGTALNVTEVGNTGYIPAVSGTVATVNNGQMNKGISTGDKTIGTGANTAIFTNTYDNTNIPTGLFIKNLPFIILIGAGILAMVAFMAINRRKARN